MANTNFQVLLQPVSKPVSSVDEKTNDPAATAKLALDIPEEKNVDPVSPSSLIENIPKFIIVCARPLDAESVDKLEHIGSTKFWDSKHYSNISIDDIQFDYLIVTLTDESRSWIVDHVINNSKYHTIALSDVYEDWIGQIHAENTIKKLPKSQLKATFDRNLLVNHVSLPSNKFKMLLKRFLLFFINLCSSAATSQLKVV